MKWRGAVVGSLLLGDWAVKLEKIWQKKGEKRYVEVPQSRSEI